MEIGKISWGESDILRVDGKSCRTLGFSSGECGLDGMGGTSCL